ncbi:MAG: response regulator [Candidatus Wallbacteria bacterium]|nr:response regulator [Candidatus Wallbacteria bacterium]
MTGKRILVADDSPTVRALLQESLTEEGYDVDAASDGVEALDHLYKHIPDVVLLDIEMPRMNGYQVLRLLREDPLVKDLPVIFLTSKGEKSDRFWGLTVGADAYLVKDADSWMLLGKIKEFLDNPPRPVTYTPGQAATFTSTTPEALMERINFLLDRKLFQATLANELASIARNPLPLRDVINQCFQLLGRVCEFHLTHLLLVSGELMTCKAGAIGLDFATQADVKFRQICTTHSLKFEFRDRLDFELSEVALRTRGVPKAVVTTTDLILRGRDGVIGLLFLASGREGVFNEIVNETLAVFAAGSSMAIDAALRARDLTRSRQSLEAAARNSTTLQAQLDTARAESLLLGQLVSALTEALGKKSLPELPQLPEGCSQELRQLVDAIRAATASH